MSEQLQRGTDFKKWTYLCNIYSSEALYSKKKEKRKIQPNLICGSDAVTYAVFTELWK